MYINCVLTMINCESECDEYRWWWREPYDEYLLVLSTWQDLNRYYSSMYYTHRTRLHRSTSTCMVNIPFCLSPFVSKLNSVNRVDWKRNSVNCVCDTLVSFRQTMYCMCNTHCVYIIHELHLIYIWTILISSLDDVHHHHHHHHRFYI